MIGGGRDGDRWDNGCGDGDGDGDGNGDGRGDRGCGVALMASCLQAVVSRRMVPENPPGPQRHGLHQGDGHPKARAHALKHLDGSYEEDDAAGEGLEWGLLALFDVVLCVPAVHLSALHVTRHLGLNLASLGRRVARGRAKGEEKVAEDLGRLNLGRLHLEAEAEEGRDQKVPI